MPPDARGPGSASTAFARHVAETGVAVVADVLTIAETAGLRDALGAHTRSRAGTRHLMGAPEIAALAADARLTSLASAVLGTSAVPFRATLFDKSHEANWLVAWHQDRALPVTASRESPGWGPWSRKGGVPYGHAPARVLERVVALRVHIDDSSTGNGPLRVLAGSHRSGILTDAQIAEMKARLPVVEALAPAGGVVILRPLAVHASSKSATPAPRRVLHLEYAASLVIDDGMELAIV